MVAVARSSVGLGWWGEDYSEQPDPTKEGHAQINEHVTLLIGFEPTDLWLIVCQWQTQLVGQGPDQQFEVDLFQLIVAFGDLEELVDAYVFENLHGVAAVPANFD